MRILVVHSFYRPSLPSGENDAVRLQVEALRGLGHEVELWGPESVDNPTLRSSVSVGLRVLADASQSPSGAITSFAPDVVHVHNLFPNISTRWIDHSPAPVLMTLHNYRLRCAGGTLTRDGRLCEVCLAGSVLPGIRHGCYRNSRPATLTVVAHQGRLMRTVRRGVDTLIFPSQFQRDKLRLTTSGTRQVVVPNYVPAIAGPATKSHQGPSSTYIVIGRLTPEKGLARLLEWWPRSARLVVAGDGPMRPALENLAQGLDVTFAGQVGPEARRDLLGRATALILPSETLEVDPLVIPEALSAGVPCVVRQHTSPAMLARESRAVRCFHDSQSLKEALGEPWDRAISREAIRLYDSRWSRHRWLSSFEEVAAEAIERNRVHRQSTM